jgi:hypothetical protein
MRVFQTQVMQGDFYPWVNYHEVKKWEDDEFEDDRQFRPSNRDELRQEFAQDDD